MLGAITVFIMLGVGYALLVEGLFTAFLMCCNVLLAGFITFNFWEPLADQLDSLFAGSFLSGYEDALCLVVLFSLTLGILRLVTNNLAFTEVAFPMAVHRAGGALCGFLTGYLVCGFLVCMMQTLPWHENFMYFEWKPEGEEGGIRKYLPPDRVWLALMRRAG